MWWKKSSPTKDVEVKLEEGQAPEWKPSTHQWAIIGVLATLAVMVSLDATMVTTSLAVISEDLNASTTQGFWIGTSYLLTSAAPMLFIAALSDAFGRPQCLFASVLSFTVGSIICCVAKTVGVMVVGRCIQGVGGGGIIILTLIVFTDIVPLRYRPQYYGLIQAAWAIGTCIGPLIGGAFATGRHWRWVFYLMFPFCAVAIVGIPILIRLDFERTHWKVTLANIDWTGAFLYIASTVSFLIAISWGGTQYPWSSWRTIVPLVLGILGLLVTIIWERYFASDPYLRVKLFYCPSSCAVYVGTFIQGLLLYGQLYYLPFYYQSVRQDSPLRTGVLMLPVLLVVTPTSAIVGKLITKSGKYRWAVWAGWPLMTLGSGLMILFSATTGLGAVVVIIMVVGLGQGLVLNALGTAAQATCHAGDETPAAAMYIFLRSLGMATGVGIGSTIFQNVTKMKLGDYNLPDMYATNAEAYIDKLVAMPTSQLKENIIASYAYGIHGVYGFFCGLAGLAMIMSIVIKQFDINKELQTDHTLKAMRWSKRLSTMEDSRAATTPDLENRDTDVPEDEKDAAVRDSSEMSVNSTSPLPQNIQGDDRTNPTRHSDKLRNITVLPDVETGPDLSQMITTEGSAAVRWLRKFSSRPPSVRTMTMSMTTERQAMQSHTPSLAPALATWGKSGPRRY